MHSISEELSTNMADYSHCGKVFHSLESFEDHFVNHCCENERVLCMLHADYSFNTIVFLSKKYGLLRSDANATLELRCCGRYFPNFNCFRQHVRFECAFPVPLIRERFTENGLELITHQVKQCHTQPTFEEAPVEDIQVEASTSKPIGPIEVIEAQQEQIFSDDELEERFDALREKHAQAEMENIPSLKLSRTLETKEAGPQAFGDGSCFKKAAPVRNWKKVKAKKEQSFKEPHHRISRLLSLQDDTIVETYSSTAIAPGRTIHTLELVAPREHEVVDTRVSDYQRTVASCKKKQALHVGPINVKLANYGSAQSNICQVGVLMDERHAETDNSVLGSFVNRVNNQEQHLTLFPGTKLPLTPDVNQVLRIHTGSSNCDIDQEYQTLCTSAIVQVHNTGKSSKPTEFTNNGEILDNAMAWRYRTEELKVIDRPQNEYKPLSTLVSVPRSTSLRYRGSGNFEVVAKPRKSIYFHAEESGDKGKSKVCHLAETLYDPQNDGNNLVYNTSITLGLSTTTGKAIFQKKIGDLLSQDQRASRKLRTCSATTCVLKVVIGVNQGITTGGECIVGFTENSTSLLHAMQRVMSGKHKVFSPFFQQDEVIFHFKPCSHMDTWNPMVCASMASQLVVVFVGPFTNPPKTDVVLPLQVYIDSADSMPVLSEGSLNVPRSLGGFDIGLAEIPQGVPNSVIIFPIFPGNPVSVTGAVVWPQAKAFCAHFASVSGTCEIGVFRHSSSFILGDVFGVLVHTASPKLLTLNDLYCLPGRKKLSQGETLFEVDLYNGGLMTPCTTETLKYDKDTLCGLVLILFSQSGITSHIDGGAHFHCYCRSISVMGASGIAKGVKNVTAYANNGVEYNSEWKSFFSYELDKDISKEDLLFDMDPLVLAYYVISKTTNTKVQYMHPSVILFESSAFASMTVELKVMWYKKAKVKVQDVVHTVSLALFPYGSEMAATDVVVSSAPSGEIIVRHHISGPFSGMRMVDNTTILGQAKEGLLRLQLQDLSTLREIHCLVRIVDLKFAGPSAGVYYLNSGWVAHTIIS